MLKKIQHQYENLSIRGKLVLGFSFLMTMLLVVIGSNKVIEVAVSDPADRSLRDTSAEMLLATRVGFEFERARYEEEIFITNFTAVGFDSERLDEAFPAVLAHVQNALDLLDTASPTSDTNEAQIRSLRESLQSYRADMEEIVNNLLPKRGDLTTGLGGEIYVPLNEINSFVDASEAMNLAAGYITRFESQAVMTLPGAITTLKQSIAAAALPAEQQQDLIALADSSFAAFRELVTHDTQEIMPHWTSVETATETLNIQLDAYIADAKQQQQAAQTQLDNADRVRDIIAWSIAALTILAGLVMAALISRSVAQPISALSNAARRVAEGDYSQRVMIDSSDEVGQLAQSFNDTIAAVAEREMQLRRQTVELRIATAKAKEAARIKSEFMANVSHELRTPLNAIIGFSDMLLMGIGGQLEANHHHKVERLRENGIRLLNLVNNILDITRIEAKRIELVQRPFSPAALIEGLQQQMEALAEKKQLAFNMVLDPDLPNTLIGDEQRLEQIVVNLLSNAFKFTDKGSVTLAVRVDRAAKQWSLIVADTGIGIPPHSREVIFEEFRQLDGSSSRAYQGSGLGLAITNNLVRIMDGHIELKSDVGRGSTFSVVLPLIESLEEEISELTGLPETIGAN